MNAPYVMPVAEYLKSIGKIPPVLLATLDTGPVDSVKSAPKRRVYEFSTTPVPAPRMVQSDAWNDRPCVRRYWAYKDDLKAQAARMDFTLAADLEVIFRIPMPPSWSKKKKALMDGKPHQQTPDIDNLTKGVFDSLSEQDNYIWSISARKYWATAGSITVRQ